MRVPFGEYQPDEPDLAHTGLEDATNVIPRSTGYGPFPDANVFSDALPSRPLSAVSLNDLDGTVFTFAGLQGALYQASDTAWTDVSRTLSYNTGAEHMWSFTTFGDTVLAVNGTDAMQVYDMGTSTRFLDQSASASAPVAHYITTVGDFVMVGRLTGQENRVQWGQINNAKRWTISQPRQADFQNLPGTGRIVGLTGGDFAAILTENSVWRGDYVGSPLLFRFQEMSPGVGCRVPGSVARWQNMTFFYSEAGFHIFDGTRAVPIGINKVDDFFKADNNVTFQYRVRATIDPINNLYIIAYPSNSSTDGTLDKMLLFNWTTGRWSPVEHRCELIYSGLSAGYTLEGLDAINTSIDALPFSLDSRAWVGGQTILSAFNSDFRSTTFDGSAKDAKLITGEAQIFPDRRAFIPGIRPLVEGDANTTITVRIGQRDRLIDSVTFGAASSMNATGVCPVRSNARFHRVRMDITGGFTRALGFDMDAVDDGVR